jgi:hypothetical protein
MAEYERINGNACAVGTIYNISSNLMLLRVQKADYSAVDLRPETIIDGVVEQIVKEINPLAFMVANAATGNIHLVVDNSIKANDLQSRIRRIGANTFPTNGTFSATYTGPNHLDISGSNVFVATTFTVTG